MQWPNRYFGSAPAEHRTPAPTLAHGTSYNASNASTCINDYANESCTDVTNNVSPASCSHICQ